jgi:lipopolysaccharide assembly protein A
MRIVYLGLIVLITLAVITFKVQNIDAVTVSFFSLSLTLSISTLILAVYILGMLTGSLVLSLIGTWIRRATRAPRSFR